MAAHAMEKLNVSDTSLSGFLSFLVQHWCNVNVFLARFSWLFGSRNTGPVSFTCASLCFTGLLHSKHSFSGAVSRPAPSEGHPCPSEDLSPCHTAGRAHCWVRTTPITTSDAGCPCSRTVVRYPSSSFFFPSSDHDGVAQWTEMSVTSGGQPAAISGTTAATNTFLIRKARTGSPGSPEVSLGTAGRAERIHMYRTRF